MSRRRVPETEREALRRWLRHVVRTSGLSPNKLAKAAGVAQSTVTRFLNGYGGDHSLSRDTIEKLAVAARVDLPKLGDFAAAAHQLLTTDNHCRNLIHQAVRLAGRVAHDREALLSSITSDPQALAAAHQDRETWLPHLTLLVLDCLIDLEKAGALDASAIAALETAFTKLARDRYQQLFLGNPLISPLPVEVAPEGSDKTAAQPQGEDRQATAKQAAA